MGRSQEHLLLQEGIAAFAEKLQLLRAERSQSQLATDMSKRGYKLSQKTISNLERGVHDSQISNFAAVAAHFGVKLWVMLVPQITHEILEAAKVRRLEQLVEHYLALEDSEREIIDRMAARLQRKK